MEQPNLVLYFLTHIVPIVFTIIFIVMFRLSSVHYNLLCKVMNITYILYLIALGAMIGWLELNNSPFCCDQSMGFIQGLWEASKLEPTIRGLYDFIWEAGPTRAWPDGYKSLFRSICVIIGYISFILMFAAIVSSHGLVMLLTIIVYSVMFVVAFHFPFALGFGIMWIFCLYYQSQALRKKYWASNNIEPPIMGEYFGDHFY